MRATRRDLFRLLGGGFALLSQSPARASREERAPEIHRATRNTWRGAVGPRSELPDEPAGPFKRYPGAPRSRLSAAAPAPAPSLGEVVRGHTPSRGFRPEPLPADTLARLLYLTNGVTGRSGATLLRAAPSAGALYAGEVYVVIGNVGGIEPGLHYYDVAHHELVQVREGDLLAGAAAALECPADLENAAALVILTNVFRRYTSRYRNRGYRYALIDSGHMGENLRLAARAAGLAERAPTRFHDDALHGLLGVDGREEAVCAVHAVGVPEPSGSASSPCTRRFTEHQDADGRALRGLRLDTQRYHEATKLVPGEDLLPPARPPPPTAARALFRVPLPLGDGPSGGFEQAIRQRRSAARFHPAPLSLADVAFVLEMARGHPARARAEGVDIALVAHRVKGLAPGLYRYEPERHRLAALQQGDLVGLLTSACAGQDTAGAAAAGLAMTARFVPPRPRAELGDRSYRDQLVEAGCIAQRVYLASEAAGLAARNLAAFLDDSLDELLELDGRREAVLHLTMFGPGE